MIRNRTAAFLAIVVAVGVVIAGLLGPLGVGAIRFHMTGLVENQYLGGEIVTLLVVAPALVVAAALWIRGSTLAPILAFGAAGYTMYTFITVIMGQEYARYPGNVGNAFFLYVALIACSMLLLMRATSHLLTMSLPDIPDGLRRSLGVLFLLIAGFFALAWTGQVLLVYKGDLPAEYVDSPGLFWLIKMLDLGFLLPAFVVTGAGVLRKRPGAMSFAGGLASYAFCMVAAVLGMAIAMHMKGDPSASTGMVVFLVPTCVLTGLVTARTLMVYRSGRRSATARPVTGGRHAATRVS